MHCYDACGFNRFQPVEYEHYRSRRAVSAD
jgi:hypothetical protein